MTSPNSSVEANEFYNAWLGSLKWGPENHPDLPERSHVLVRAIYADAMNVRSVSLMEMVEETADAAGIRNLENEAFQSAGSRQAGSTASAGLISGIVTVKRLLNFTKPFG